MSPKKSHNKLYIQLLILIAVFSVLNTVGSWVGKPIKFFTRLEAAENQISIHDKRFDRIESKLDKILFRLPIN